MRRALLFLLIAILTRASFAWADLPSPRQTSYCRPCPQGTKEISILIVSDPHEEEIFERGRPLNWFNSVRAKRETPVRKYHDNIEETTAIKTILEHAAAKCERVRSLGIDSHGSPGSLLFSNDSLTIKKLDDVFHGLDCVMAPGADIHFGGCSIARDCRGEDFLAAVATVLLRQSGGSVEGPTNSSYPYNFEGDKPKFKDQFQALRVDTGLTHPQWRSPPRTKEYCEGLAIKEADDLLALEQRFKTCRKPFPDKDLLDFTLQGLRVAADGDPSRAYGPPSAPFAQVDQAGINASWSYFSHFQNAAYIRARNEPLVSNPIACLLGGRTAERTSHSPIGARNAR